MFPNCIPNIVRVHYVFSIFCFQIGNWYNRFACKIRKGFYECGALAILNMSSDGFYLPVIFLFWDSRLLIPPWPFGRVMFSMYWLRLIWVLRKEVAQFHNVSVTIGFPSSSFHLFHYLSTYFLLSSRPCFLSDPDKWQFAWLIILLVTELGLCLILDFSYDIFYQYL